MTRHESTFGGPLVRFGVAIYLGTTIASVAPDVFLAALQLRAWRAEAFHTVPAAVPAIVVGFAAVAVDWDDRPTLRDVGAAGALGVLAQVLVLWTIDVFGGRQLTALELLGPLYQMLSAAAVAMVTAYVAAEYLPTDADRTVLTTADGARRDDS